VIEAGQINGFYEITPVAWFVITGISIVIWLLSFYLDDTDAIKSNIIGSTVITLVVFTITSGVIATKSGCH
jgi:hypothetical protein